MVHKKSINTTMFDYNDSEHKKGKLHYVMQKCIQNHSTEMEYVCFIQKVSNARGIQKLSFAICAYKRYHSFNAVL